jgi:hypothetical protein
MKINIFSGSNQKRISSVKRAANSVKGDLELIKTYRELTIFKDDSIISRSEEVSLKRNK